jgi:3-polyprenyl-4-hydroxybenzoate decarboxylase
VDYVAAVMRLPVDELGLVASLRDAPLAVVKCVSCDIRVPADAEWVLEGCLDERGHVEAEGPYGEFLGYYGAVKQNPVFHLTAITRRRDALFQTATIGGRHLARTDTAQLNALRTEVMVWRALETAVREAKAVYATPASGGMYNLRIALRQRVPGEARNAIAAAFGCLANVKHVFVVDPDVDIFSEEQMDWALATRFQADRDLVVQSGFRTLPLDPSLAGARTGAKAGFDLTLPVGEARGIESTIPEPPRLEGKRFASVEAALADGPKRFEALMAALASRDGRESCSRSGAGEAGRPPGRRTAAAVESGQCPVFSGDHARCRGCGAMAGAHAADDRSRACRGWKPTASTSPCSRLAWSSTRPAAATRARFSWCTVGTRPRATTAATSPGSSGRFTS